MSRGFTVVDSLSTDLAEKLARLAQVARNVSAEVTVIAHPSKFDRVERDSTDIVGIAADAVRQARARRHWYLQGDRRGKKTLELDYEIARAVIEVVGNG